MTRRIRPCPAARKMMAELAVDRLEARRDAFIARRRPVPHKLALALESARTQALKEGPQARP